MSVDSSTFTRNNTYLLTLQPNCMCNHLSDEEIHNADATFCEKAWQKCLPIRARHLQKRDFKTKASDCVASRLAMGL